MMNVRLSFVFHPLSYSVHAPTNRLIGNECSIFKDTFKYVSFICIFPADVSCVPWRAVSDCFLFDEHSQ